MVLLIYMATALLDLHGQIQTIQVEREELNQQVAAQQLENQQLANAIENSDDPDMLESVARDKGYVKSGRPSTSTWPTDHPGNGLRGNLQGGYISRLWSLVLGPLWMGRLRESQNWCLCGPCRKGRSGLVHISEIAYSYVNEVSDHLKEGQEVKVKVIGIDQNNRINLSIKKVTEPPPARPAADRADGPVPGGRAAWRLRAPACRAQGAH